jgi:hypothetical protein
VFLAVPIYQLIALRLIDWGNWRYVIATLVAGAVGLVTLVIAFYVVIWIVKSPNRRHVRKVKNASDEELWQMVDREPWHFKSTIALLQLAVRGCDIDRVLPRVVQMLGSDDYAQRAAACEVLDWVFIDEYRAIGGDKSGDSYDDCRANAAKLQTLLEAKKE